MRLCGFSSRFQLLFPCMRQVTHALLTRPPLDRISASTNLLSFDLHVLSTPPAFILSQDQTLNKMVSKEPRLFKSLYWSSFQLQRNLTVVLQAQACLNNQIQIWCFVFSLRCLIYKVHAVHRRVLILPHSNSFVKNFFQILFNLFLRGPLAFQRRF